VLVVGIYFGDYDNNNNVNEGERKDSMVRMLF